MSDWVKFLRDDGTKQAYKTFKQELEGERAYMRRKNIFEKVKEFKETQRPARIKKMREKYERVKGLSKKITFTSP